MIASEKGYQEICQLLIKNGADVNAESYFKSTPLIAASNYGNKPLCELLIVNGADVNALNIAGATPLICASFEGYKEICELLIRNGADVNKSGLYTYSALSCASLRGHKEICELLIANGAYINFNIIPLEVYKRSYRYYTESKYEIGMPIEMYELIDQRAYKWDSPMTYAIEEGNLEICKLLIRNGADVNAKDMIGRSPLMLASLYNDKKICELLIVNNCNIEIGDEAFEEILRNGWFDLCSIIMRKYSFERRKHILDFYYSFWVGMGNSLSPRSQIGRRPIGL